MDKSRIELIQDGYDEQWSMADERIFLQAQHILTANMIEEGPVLDLGCGHGHFLALLKSRGLEVEGIELSEVGVKVCRKKGLNVNQGNLDDISTLKKFKDQSFNYVTIIGAIESTFEAVPILEEMKRIGKTVIITSPNYSYLIYRLQFLLTGYHHGFIYKYSWTTSNFITQRWLDRVVGLSGLEVVERAYAYPHDFKTLIGSKTKKFKGAQGVVDLPLAYKLGKPFFNLRPSLFARFLIYKCR